MKEGYKMTEIGEIPLDWEVVELGQLIRKIIGGGTPARDVEEYWLPELPWATVKI